MGHLRELLRTVLPNPFFKVLNGLKTEARLLFFWNRGLGDIPLELYPLLKALFTRLPEAEVTFITRADLFEGFLLLDFPIKVLISPHLVRKSEENYEMILDELGLTKELFNHIFYQPNPAYWVKKEKKGLICKLEWQEAFFTPVKIETTKPLALLHLHSETLYGFEKNLPLSTWEKIIADLKAKGYFTIALGHNSKIPTTCDLDLRSKTSLHQIISLMLHYEPLFIGPDSGLLNILYYLNLQKPWHLISYWANPRVGLLKQATPSPNPQLKLDVIQAPQEDLLAISPHLITECIEDLTVFDQVHLEKKPLSLLKKLTGIHAAITTTQSLQLATVPSFTEALNPPCTNVTEFSFDPRVIPIILAGGHGTRLETDLPKALFEIDGRSLLSFFCQKIKQAIDTLGRDLSAYMIVSPEGYPPILNHLTQHHYFGLKEHNLKLLIQNQLPFITEENKLALNPSLALYQGPCGNGEVFKLLKEHNIFDSLAKDVLGFEIVPIDNPLAPLFCHHYATSFLQGYDACVIAIEVDEKENSLGKLALIEKKLTIIEYTQNPPQNLLYANTGLLGFSLEFAKRLSTMAPLPHHIAYKNYLCFTGEKMETLRIKKFETFIFDHLQWAQTVQILSAKKEALFQPLKTQKGPYGVEALKKALALQSFKIC